MLVPIRKLGSVGVIARQDYPPSEIPPNAFTVASNAVFRDGFAQKAPGWLPFLTDLANDQLWMQVWESSQRVTLALFSGAAIETSIDATNVVASTTRTANGASPVTLLTATRWVSDVFGQFCVATNQVNSAPFYSHSFNAGTSVWEFRELPGWGAATSPSGPVKVIRSFNNHLVALGVDANPYTVFLSDLGSPETIPQSWDYGDPTKLARRFPLQSKDGPIVDGGLLSDRFIVYQRNAAVALEYIGGEFVVAARRIFNFGLINADAWTQFNNFHFVVAENAIYTHDGAVVSRPDDNFVEKKFFGEISDPEKVYVTRDEMMHEILVYYTTGEAQYPNRVMVYNWLEKTWSFLDLEVEVRRLVYGVGPAPATTWAQLLNTWGEINETWGQLARTDRSTKLLQLRQNAVDVVGVAFSRSYGHRDLAAVDDADDIAIDNNDDLVWYGHASAEDYLAYAERNYVDLDEVAQNSAAVKYVKGAYLQCSGSGRLDIQFGVSDSPRSPIRWAPAYSFFLDEDVSRVKVDFRVTGRYLHWRFGQWEGNPAPSSWRVSSVDLDIQLEGVR